MYPLSTFFLNILQMNTSFMLMIISWSRIANRINQWRSKEIFLLFTKKIDTFQVLPAWKVITTNEMYRELALALPVDQIPIMEEVIKGISCADLYTLYTSRAIPTIEPFPPLHLQSCLSFSHTLIYISISRNVNIESVRIASGAPRRSSESS